MIHLRLCDEDRKRLGVDVEWLDIDAYSVTAREAAILQRGFDLDGERVAYAHPGLWRGALTQKPLPDPNAMLVLVWLALRRIDITTPLGDLDFNLDLLAYNVDRAEPEGGEEVDPDASPGKDDGPEPEPNSSAENTTSTP